MHLLKYKSERIKQQKILFTDVFSTIITQQACKSYYLLTTIPFDTNVLTVFVFSNQHLLHTKTNTTKYRFCNITSHNHIKYHQKQSPCVVCVCVSCVACLLLGVDTGWCILDNNTLLLHQS